MASPQTENGYTKLANELLEALCALQISGSEWSVVMCIIRKTYGYHKTEDWVTNTQIAKATGLHKVRVSEAKSRLLEAGIITEKRNKISLDKDYEKWSKLRKSVTGVTEKRNKSYGKAYLQKKKETIQKKLSEANASAEKIMFNSKSDDYEEGFIDLDGNGELKEEKAPRPKKYPNAPAVRKLFQEILGRNPANWKVNKTQLQACENLSTERTIEKVRSALEFYKDNEEEKYCPKISSPYDLDSKWTKLGEFKLKQK